MRRIAELLHGIEGIGLASGGCAIGDNDASTRLADPAYFLEHCQRIEKVMEGKAVLTMENLPAE